MQKNIGALDRLIRLLVACVLLLIAWWKGSGLILLFSLFTFYEALVSWCLLYQLIGKNSCPLDSRKDK
jgi:hypothetical protein